MGTTSSPKTSWQVRSSAPIPRQNGIEHIRHGIILSVAVLLLAAALVLAYLVNTRAIVIDALEPKPVAEAPVAPHSACPRDQFDYVDPSKMTINVMNGTQIAGLAGASAKKLEKRGFKVGEVGNARMSKANVVGAVISGPDGYAQAMTVQRHVAGLTYVFDPKRQGKTVAATCFRLDLCVRSETAGQDGRPGYRHQIQKAGQGSEGKHPARKAWMQQQKENDGSGQAGTVEVS